MSVTTRSRASMVAHTFHPAGCVTIEPALSPRREAVPFRETRKMKVVRTVVGAHSRVTPRMAVHFAHRAPVTPPNAAERPWRANLQLKACTTEFRFGADNLAVYEWGGRPS